MNDINRIKDRIRKLLNLAADDGAAEGEIDNALRAARQLMLANQLSEDDVTAAPEDLRTPEEIAADATYGTAKSWGDAEREPLWKGCLARVVAEFMGTVQCYHDSPKVLRKATGIVANDGLPVSGWVFYGPAEDCVLAAELHTELLMTCAATAKLKYGGTLLKGPGRDYCDGFVSGLRDKVYASQKEDKIAGAIVDDCRTLSVVDQQRARDIAVAKIFRGSEWLKKEKGVMLRSGSGRGRDIGNSDAYGQGQSDGGSQTMSKTRTAKIEYGVRH